MECTPIPAPAGGCVPKDGLCPSECPPHFLFLLAKKKTCRTRYKRKSVRDELTRKGPTHPKRGAGRYALPIKSKSFLPAAPIGVPCGTALPHLGARNSLGCKEDAPCSLFRCRWRSFAERAALSNARSAERETEGVLSAPRGLRFDHHGVPGWTTAAPRPCHAGTDRFQSRTVENRIPQACAPPQVWTQALFFSTAAAATFLLARQKKSGGRILCGTQPLRKQGEWGSKARFPAGATRKTPENSLGRPRGDMRGLT